MYGIVRKLMSVLVLMIAICSMPQVLKADEPAAEPTGPSEARILADEIDVLELVAKLKLTEKQVAFVADSAARLAQKREELFKKEEALLRAMKDSLQKKRDALAAGKEVPSSVEAVTSGKLKEILALREQARKDTQSAVNACVQLLSEGQIRRIKRNPEAIKCATAIVGQIRSASPQEWPEVLARFTSELLDVKKYDKLPEWQTEIEKLEALKGQERDEAVKAFEDGKEGEIAQMQTEIRDMLISIRNADPRVLSIGVNKVASAVRPQADVRAELAAMIRGIIDIPNAESALKARLESMKSASD